MIADTSSVAATEDSMADFITKLRRARSTELKSLRAEAEKKLEDLTEKRMDRSRLNKTIESLEASLEKVKEQHRKQSKAVSDSSNDIHEIDERISRYICDGYRLKQEIGEMEKKLEDSQAASTELGVVSGNIENEIEEAKIRLSSVVEELKEAERKESGVDSRMSELKGELSVAQRERDVAVERAKLVQEKFDSIDKKLGGNLKQLLQIIDGSQS